MKRKLNFRRRLFISRLSIFVVFTLMILIFQAQREKEFRRSQLENTLDNITIIMNNYLVKNHIFSSADYSSLKSLLEILPQSGIRITIADAMGLVLFDSEVSDVSGMENHLNRPEIQESVGSEFGANIRTSSTTNEAYYYYARFYGKYFVRTAVHYNNNIIDYLKADQLFLFFITALFIILWLVLNALTNKLAKTIDQLKDFVIRLNTGEHIPEEIQFPDDELGVISRQIIKVYKELENTKDTIMLEREKLYNHLNALNEGVAFFSSKKEKTLTNNHFIQFLNIISEKSSISAEKVFKVEEFRPVLNFISDHINDGVLISGNKLPRSEYGLHKNGHYFNIKCIIFADKSFEIIITDTTRLVKRHIIKQQITSNITHELKTPVAAVMGFLETLQGDKLDKEKQFYFIDKAFAQANRLKELIEDILVLNKIEESIGKFTLEPMILKKIIDEVIENFKIPITEKGIDIRSNVSEQIVVNGNQELLISIFHNLIDNSIKYAGDDTVINISQYSLDEKYYYLSLSDTGIGIPEEHLNRIFERFYRIDSGRSRKTGGTGLGLAIVKNAIQSLRGNISVRNSKKGGLEFLFTLPRSSG